MPAEPTIDPTIAARLPALHEQQERQESDNVLASGLADEFGVSARDWGDGVWSVRCAKARSHGAANQIMGVGASRLQLLEGILPWFDEARCSARLRLPGYDVDDEVGETLRTLGFAVEELEAWMAAPIASLEVESSPHEIRLAEDPSTVQEFVDALCSGWKIEGVDQRQIAGAAMGPYPGPDHWRRYVAYVEGAVAGEGVASLYGDIAYLAEASTVPKYRRRGIQSALIARRVEDARAAGARVVFASVKYGDGSWSNMRAVGLREANLTLRFKRSPPAV